MPLSDASGPERRSPLKTGHQNGTSAKLMTTHRRQQALQRCLDLCDSLGFNEQAAGTESVVPETNRDSTAKQIGSLLDAADQAITKDSAERVSSNASLYGALLRPEELKAKVAQLNEAQSTLDFIHKNQDCLVNFLQQPLPALTIEQGGQQALLNLLQHASKDGQVLGQGLEDLAWVIKFNESAASWPKLLHPLPQAAIAVVHSHEGLTALLKSLELVAAANHVPTGQDVDLVTASPSIPSS